MSEKHTRSARRRFMKSAALAAGAASVTAAGGAAAIEPALSTTTTPAHGEAPDAKGYHVTHHIEAYYRLARQ